MPFTPLDTVPVELLADGRLRVLADVTWTGLFGDTVVIPAGTISDLASVPWFLRAVIARDGRIARAALVHDVLCDALKRYQAELDDWEQGERINRDAINRGHGRIIVQGDRPTPPAFSSVDADHVFRLIARELGTPPVLARLYWTGVRYGAAWQRHRRAGWWSWRDVPAVILFSLLALIILPWAAAGALVSRLLLAVVEWLAAPFTGRPARRRGDARGGRRRRAPLERSAPPAHRYASVQLSRRDLEQWDLGDIVGGMRLVEVVERLGTDPAAARITLGFADQQPPMGRTPR